MDLRSIARLRTSKPPRQTMPAGRKLCSESCNCQRWHKAQGVVCWGTLPLREE